MAQDISKTYNPKETEGRIYDLWLKNDAFSPTTPSTRRAEPSGRRPFVIVIPPPNVTGSLHMGHALNNTVQDILIRRARMRGLPTLWVPGTDHAGIATQNVVEKQLQKEGKSRHDLGRLEFEKRVWQWVREYGHIIIDQLQKMGCSCDWSHQRFTMDEGYSEAVNAAFKHYYDKGWIYEGERVINWCVRCQTALSDIELEHKEIEGKLWYIKYPIINSKSEARNSKQILNSKFKIQNSITVATTRPETMLGDTAVAVHPDDERYKDLVGKKVMLPLVNREIPIVADEVVDPKFGTGAVKVTPAHDPNDFDIGERHQLEKIKVINEIGKIIDTPYAGQKAGEARENILKDLEKEGLLEKTADFSHSVPHCYRCGRQVEQLLSKQWFLKMKELAGPAIEAVKSGEIKFTPKRWEKVYLDWMGGLKDWCISRQIWWGHRLPVWQPKIRSSKSETCLAESRRVLNKSQIQNSNDQKNNSSALEIRNSDLEIYVGSNPPVGYEQSSDVLDTWFSSALWPFAALGWPKETEDLKNFYPTTILSTARDIIYLWVARMIFSGYEFMKAKPFSEVYIHPTIFNIEGKRMSKSLGTGVDPLELIDKYGADATRFGLCYINTGIQDIKFDENAILAGQKFANKIWNIARFVISQIHNSEFRIQNSKPDPKTEADRRITQSLNHLITSVNADLDNFRFGQAAHSLYDFVWHDFADQYLEIAKKQLEDNKLKESTLSILHYELINSLILLHPLMPFLTEEIWQNLYQEKLVEEKLLITAKWPE